MSAGEQMQRQWWRHRTILQDILVRVPDDKFDFKPWPNGMTLADLAVHMAAAADMFAQAVGAKWGHSIKHRVFCREIYA